MCAVLVQQAALPGPPWSGRDRRLTLQSVRLYMTPLPVGFHTDWIFASGFQEVRIADRSPICQSSKVTAVLVVMAKDICPINMHAVAGGLAC